MDACVGPEKGRVENYFEERDEEDYYYPSAEPKLAFAARFRLGGPRSLGHM